MSNSKHGSSFIHPLGSQIFDTVLFMPNLHHLQDHPITGSPSLAWGVGKKRVIFKLEIHKSAEFHRPYSL